LKKFLIECEANERQCADGKKCIQKYWICDGEKDCDDGSDEKDSFCSKFLFKIKSVDI
jgi:hypothetical protein